MNQLYAFFLIKMTASQGGKKFPAPYATEKYIAVDITVRHQNPS